MKFFIDTAIVDEIRAAHRLGVVAGVTTNPSLMAKAGQDPKEVIQEIASFVNGPISAEVLAEDADGMVREGREWAKVAPQVTVKVPLTAEGLAATRVLADEGVKVNVTLIFNASQALLAARAGAAFVSPFIGRLDDIGANGSELVRTIATIFKEHHIATEIIAASIRRPLDITEAALAGAHIATVPYKVLLAALEHPLTKAGIERFAEDWRQVTQKTK